MTLRSYLFIMTMATIVCFCLLILIINMIDPENTNWPGFVLFYLAAFLSLTGTSSILGFFVRFVALKKELVFYSVKAAFRQSFLLSFLIIANLYLLSKNLFTWTNLFLLVFGLSIIEYLMLSFSRDAHRLLVNDNQKNQDSEGEVILEE